MSSPSLRLDLSKLLAEARKGEVAGFASLAVCLRVRRALATQLTDLSVHFLAKVGDFLVGMAKSRIESCFLCWAPSRMSRS